MSFTWVGIVFILLILLGGFLGWRKGALRTLINLIGLVAILILSFQFKDFLGTLIIKYMPFFNFAGDYVGVLAVNYLFYQAIAFVIVFLLLYCVLNILINLSGMVEVIDRFTKLFELPAKIIGAVLGAVESIVYVFVIVFVALSVPTTAGFMIKDKVAMTVVNKTPVLIQVFGYSILAEQKQYEHVTTRPKGDDGTYTKEGTDEASLRIIRDLIQYDVVEASLIQQTIDDKKVGLDNVTVASAK